MVKRLLVLLFPILMLAGVRAQVTIEWAPSLATEVYSNCPAQLNVVQAVVHNNSDSVFGTCYFECSMSSIGNFNSPDTVHNLAPGTSATLRCVSLALSPGNYNLSIRLHGTSLQISTTVNVVYCRNVGIDAILEPTTTGTYVEGDPITLRARFRNFGANELGTNSSNTFYWMVYNVDGSLAISATPLERMQHGQTVDQTGTVNLPMGFYGQQRIKVDLQPDNDQYVGDNEDSVFINIIPAYNPKAVALEVPSNQCGMTATSVTLVLVNEGGKPIPAGHTIKVGYEAGVSATSPSVATLPVSNSENYILTADWGVGETLRIPFVQKANLYPTGLMQDIDIRMRGWCHYEQDASHLDHILTNDTTAYKTVRSLYSPAAPQINDTTIPYATRTTRTASQGQSLAIRWYNDTNATPFINSNIYSQTTTYTTPRLFQDTALFLRSRANNGCWSQYRKATIHLVRQPYDAGVTAVLAPVDGQTCTEHDTVRVRVCNYGTNAMTDAPVAFEVYRMNGGSTDFVQLARDTVRSTIASDACIDYTFRPLLTFPLQDVGQTNRYIVSAWTEHPSDVVHQNDTTRDTMRLTVAAAYNVSALAVSTPSGQCRMEAVPVTLTLVNMGRKAIPSGDSLLIGYAATTTTTGVTTLPATHTEFYKLAADWAVGETLTVVLAQTANLYPTGLQSDISVRVRGWATYDLDEVHKDVVNANDTTPYITVRSLYAPDAPVVADVTMPYATRTTIGATQNESLPIRWYTDTLATPFINSNIYVQTTSYATPQLFNDTTYYLRSRANNGCWSRTSRTRITLVRSPYDAGVTDILLPLDSQVITEHDTVRVRVCNYGTSPLVNTPIAFEMRCINGSGSDFIQLERDTIRSTIASDVCEVFTFSRLFEIPMQYVGQTNHYSVAAWTEHPSDGVHQNDTTIDTVRLTVIAAYNLQSLSVSASGGLCRMTATPVTMRLVNVGLKSLPAGDSVLIGYRATTATAGVTSLPHSHTEYYVLDTDWEVNDTIEVIFRQPANLYPTGVLSDITVSLRGWATYDMGERKDNIRGNDTSSAVPVRSLYSPDAPVVADVHLPYASRTVLHASQSDSLPISWYGDTLVAPFHAPSSYEASTTWSTPQYFADTTYYLRSVGTNGCYSDYGPARIILNVRVAQDAGVSEVLLPQKEMVYTENDTVRIRVCNYGYDTLFTTPVNFNLHRVSGGSYMLVQIAADTIRTPIAPDQCEIHTFSPLAIIPEPYRNQDNQYALVAWTSHPDDPVAQNDTLFEEYLFRTLPETAYCSPTIANPNSVDIVSVHYNALANEVSPLGHSVINFGLYDTARRIVPALHVVRGETDTMVVTIENSADLNDHSTVCSILLLVDYNRNGDFGDYNEAVRSSIITSGGRAAFPFTIHPSAHYGYMRMRLMVIPGADVVMEACMSMPSGAVQDYLLYVEPAAPDTDALMVRYAAPETPIIDDAAQAVSVVVANHGSSIIDRPILHYHYSSPDPAGCDSGVFPWVGNIFPGHSVVINLPAHNFPLGTTDITVSVEVAGDNDASNDTIRYQVHRFHTERALYIDNYDLPSRSDHWYSPRGDYPYNRNLWQRGMPASSVIRGTYSGDNAWATLLTSPILVGPEGNRSVLYSPLFDISISRPDTLSFYLNQNFGSGSRLTVEYLDQNGQWKLLRIISGSDWYTSAAGFSTDNSNGYQKKYVAMSLDHIQSTLGLSRTQFRFVYTADIASESGKNYNDGCAIDNFRLGHMRGHIDVGPTEVTAFSNPQRRRSIFPWVLIHNYGLDTVCNIPVEYLVYGATDYVRETFVGCIPPGATDTHFFQTPFVCGINFPDTFSIFVSTSLATDIYWENDSLRSFYIVDPTDDDIEVQQYLSPRRSEIASDTVEVTIRLCNNGTYPILDVPLYFNYNNQYEVYDTVDFVALLGEEGLTGHQCCNYTLDSQYHVSIGITSLLTYVVMPYDIKSSNDTLEALFNGLTFARDLEAVDIVVDASNPAGATIQLGIRNAGAQMVNDFYIGFYLDGDSSQVFIQHVTDLGLNALSNGYRKFDTILPHRDMGYNNITAFVYIDEDIDRSNDTTILIAEPFVDVRVIKVIVQENDAEDCPVRVRLINMGNYTLTDTYKIVVVLNGETLVMECNIPLLPMQTVDIELDVHARKSENRTYVGSATVSVYVDSDPANNQTTSVETVSLFIGIDDVLAEVSSLWLGQNYPNPASDHTTFDFSLSTPTMATISVVDASGRLVYVAKGYYAEGSHKHSLSLSHFPSGIYYYMVQTASERRIRKMIVR
ncbi:MAG: T9SS type A sorting domain-containing protein [Bacteroidales bacterium]|nr:T9SS type A sorting domain-containing protein [Bacteroidales bacterium]